MPSSRLRELFFLPSCISFVLQDHNRNSTHTVKPFPVITTVLESVPSSPFRSTQDEPHPEPAFCSAASVHLHCLPDVTPVSHASASLPHFHLVSWVETSNVIMAAKLGLCSSVSSTLQQNCCPGCLVSPEPHPLAASGAWV